MKTKFFAILAIAAGLVVLGARAQTPAPATDSVAAPQASQYVYAPRLPSVAELSNAAGAQGLTIDKVIQTASQMTVVYRSSNGQTNTVAYMLLPAAGSTSATSTVAVATTTPPPTVVYAAPAPAPVYYYDPFYYPSYMPVPGIRRFRSTSVLAGVGATAIMAAITAMVAASTVDITDLKI